MIRDNLYEPIETSNISMEIDYKPTTIIPSIPINTQAFTNSYWMGYLSDRNLSSINSIGEIVIDEVDEAINFQTSEIEDYRNFTYFGFYNAKNASGTLQSANNAFYQYNAQGTSKWEPSASNNYRNLARLVNEMDYQGFSYCWVVLQFCWAKTPATTSDFTFQANSGYRAASRASSSSTGLGVYMTIKEFKEFLKGTFSFRLTFPGMETQTITIDRFDQNGFIWLKRQDADETVQPAISRDYECLFIQNFTFTENLFTEIDINNWHTPTSTEYQKIFIEPAYEQFYQGVEDETETQELVVNRSSIWNSYMGFLSFKTLNTNNFQITDFSVDSSQWVSNVKPANGTTNEIYNVPIALNGAHGSFSFTEFNNLALSSFPKYNGNVIIGRGSGSSNVDQLLKVALLPIEIYKLATTMRWVCVSESTTAEDTTFNAKGYKKDVVYYPLVDLEKNEFLGDLITGSEAQIASKIPTWMKEGLETADYDNKDKPEKDDPTTNKKISEKPDPNDYGQNLTLRATNGVVNHSVSGTEIHGLMIDGVREMFEKLWASPQNFWDALGKNKTQDANALKYIVSLKAFPFQVYNSGDSVSTTQTVWLGAGGALTLQTNNFYTLPTAYRIINFGSIHYPDDGAFRYNMEFMNYAPYTRVIIHLPFIGDCEINPKYIMDDRWLSITLVVDLRTGDSAYIVLSSQNPGEGGQPVLIKTTNIGFDIALSGSDMAVQSANIINANLSETKSAVNFVTGTIGSTTSNIKNITGEDKIKVAAGIADVAGTGINGLIDLVAASNNRATMSREIPELKGGTTGISGLITDSYCYIIVQRPIYYLPKNFGHAMGYLCMQTKTIGRLNGFTKCGNVDLSSITATVEELAEIEDLLTSGFFAGNGGSNSN